MCFQALARAHNGDGLSIQNPSLGILGTACWLCEVHSKKKFHQNLCGWWMSIADTSSSLSARGRFLCRVPGLTCHDMFHNLPWKMDSALWTSRSHISIKKVCVDILLLSRSRLTHELGDRRRPRSEGRPWCILFVPRVSLTIGAWRTSSETCS